MISQLKGKNCTYNIQQTPLSVGGQGNVYIGTSGKGEYVAIKQYFDKKNLNQDIQMVQKIGKHENLVSVIEVIDSFIVMEMCNQGDLKRFIDRGSKELFTIDDLKICIDLLIQIVVGMEKIQAVGVSHRDIKPQNIFLHQDKQSNKLIVKIGDFGCCKENDLMKTVIGTPQYMSPEIFEKPNKDVLYTDQVDVFSFGALFFEVITKNQLIECGDKDVYQIFKKVLLFKPEKIQLHPKITDIPQLDEIRDLIIKCLNKVPEKRPKFKEIKEVLLKIQHNILEEEEQYNKSFEDFNFNDCIQEEDQIDQLDKIENQSNPLESKIRYESIIQEDKWKKENKASTQKLPNIELVRGDSQQIELLFQYQNTIIQNFKNREYKQFNFEQIAVKYVSKVSENLYRYAKSKEFNKNVLDIDDEFEGIIAADNMELCLAPLIFHKIFKDNFNLLKKISDMLLINNTLTYNDQIIGLRILQDFIDKNKNGFQILDLNQFIWDLFADDHICQILVKVLNAFLNAETKNQYNCEQIVEKQETLNLPCNIKLKGIIYQKDNQFTESDLTIYLCKSFCSQKKYIILLPKATISKLF